MYINPRYAVLAGTATAGAVVGGLVGYRIAATRYVHYFDQTLEKEIEGTIGHLESRINNLERENESLKNPPTFEDLTVEPNGPVHDELLEGARKAHTAYNRVTPTTPKDVAEALQTLKSIAPEDTEVVAEVVVTETNVFERDGVDEDVLDKENRDPTIPYVIDEDEFGNNEYNHDQSEFVYYQGDDILTDQRDEVIADVEETVGEDNLTKFGSGSRNPNVVYVRNERLGLDFEITRVDGRYSEHVAGFIRHSQDHRRPRRFRGDDE